MVGGVKPQQSGRVGNLLPTTLLLNYLRGQQVAHPTVLIPSHSPSKLQKTRIAIGLQGGRFSYNTSAA